MNDLSQILFPAISFLGAACLVLLVSFDYRAIQKEVVRLFAHASEYSTEKIQFELRQARYLRNALISFHLSSVCFVLSAPVSGAKLLGRLHASFLVTLFWVVGFGCMIYGIINLLNKLGNEHS